MSSLGLQPTCWSANKHCASDLPPLNDLPFKLCLKWTSQDIHLQGIAPTGWMAPCCHDKRPTAMQLLLLGPAALGCVLVTVTSMGRQQTPLQVPQHSCSQFNIQTVSLCVWANSTSFVLRFIVHLITWALQQTHKMQEICPKAVGKLGIRYTVLS